MPSSEPDSLTSIRTDWPNLVVAVAGLGEVGFSAIDALHHLGATVVGIDSREISPELAERAELFSYLGVELRYGVGDDPADPEGFAAIVVAESWMADSAFVERAQSANAMMWSEVELAWRIRGEHAAPWIVVAGTEGGSDAVKILEQILVGAGVRALAVGHGNASVLESVMDPEGPTALIVELSETHLRWPTSFSPVSAAVRGVLSADHLDNPFDRTQVACIYEVQNPAGRKLVEDADVIEGARAVGVSIASPSLGEIGVVDDIVADRAFGADPRHEAEELFTLDDLGKSEVNLVVSSLVAAALARSIGVKAHSLRTGIQRFAGASG